MKKVGENLLFSLSLSLLLLIAFLRTISIIFHLPGFWS